MEDKSEFYKTNSIQSMIFSYNIKKGRSKEKVSLDNLNLRYQDFQHHKLPISMNPLKYGLLINKKDNEFTIQINDTNLALIIQEENKNIVKIFRKGVKVYEYIDIKINDSTFIRELLNKKFTFINNELALLTIDKKVKFIKSLKKGRKSKR
jgi:hypothetical protein